MKEKQRKPKKALIVATVGRFLNFEHNNIKMLQDMGYEVYCATNLTIEEIDKIPHIDVIKHQIDFARSPLSFSNVKAYKELCRLIERENFDFVHCHTPVGGILTRLASRKYRKNGMKVFYTAHGFHFYKGAPLINWLIFYTAEWICSWYTDVLITINTEDYALAKKRLHAKHIEYVPGAGVDIKKFQSISVNKAEKRKELGIPENKIFFLSVGELNENKNHSTVIRALAKLKDKNICYCIAGSGVERENLEKLIKELDLIETVHLIGYRKDVAELLHAADVFLLPSFREGLNVSVMEAMASGLPCIISHIRGNVDLIDENGGVLFAPASVEECKNAIENLLCKDLDEIGKYNMNKIEKFGMESVSKRVMQIYSNI